MTNIVKISIRIFIIFTVFQFITNFLTSVYSFMNLVNFDQMYTSLDGIELLKVLLPFIIECCVFLIVFIILWIKNEVIAQKIVGKNQIENINITLDYKNVLSIGLIIIGIFLIIDTLPILFSYISNLIISKSRFVDKDYLKEYTIKEIVEMTGIVIKIIISFFLINNNQKIIEKIMEINKTKPVG